MLTSNLPQYECCAFIIDTWVDSVSGGRSNISPTKLPWEIIRALVIITYGGKIDNEGDYSQLTALVSNFLTPAAFENDHKVIADPTILSPTDTNSPTEKGILEMLTLPNSTGVKDFMDWVGRLPEREPPTFLGLPSNAEKLLLVGQGTAVVSDLRRITEALDEGEKVMAEATAEESQEGL